MDNKIIVDRWIVCEDHKINMDEKQLSLEQLQEISTELNMQIRHCLESLHNKNC